jgi:hypothetical protein
VGRPESAKIRPGRGNSGRGAGLWYGQTVNGGRKWQSILFQLADFSGFIGQLQPGQGGMALNSTLGIAS